MRLAAYQIRKIADCACSGNARSVFPATDFKRKTLVSDYGMHHGTCARHVPWCMSGSLTCGGEENVPCIPSACATHNFTYLVRGPLGTHMSQTGIKCRMLVYISTLSLFSIAHMYGCLTFISQTYHMCREALPRRQGELRCVPCFCWSTDGWSTNHQRTFKDLHHRKLHPWRTSSWNTNSAEIKSDIQF